MFELQAGDQVENSSGRWMRKRRLIDRGQDLYEETVVDAETGEVRTDCREPLSQHWGHGSAKAGSTGREAPRLHTAGKSDPPAAPGRR